MANPYILPLLNKLYAGKKITLDFTSEHERESFRCRLYKIKRTQDEALVALLDERKLILRNEMSIVNEGEDVKFRSVFWMEEQKPLNFSIVSIEDIEPAKDDNDGSSRQASLPISVGKTGSERAGDSGQDST